MPNIFWPTPASGEFTQPRAYSFEDLCILNYIERVDNKKIQRMSHLGGPRFHSRFKQFRKDRLFREVAKK